MPPGDDSADVTAQSGETATHDAASRTATAGSDWQGAPIELGARMGRYELRSLVGTGGMGVVFEAHDPELDRTVAVKILRAGSMAGSDGERRLRREGQTMARLTHPNVLRVYDVGLDHGHVFVAMEFIAGGTLADWLERAPRTADEIVATFVQAGQGLAAAHDAGLVHRDFKPANVMVAEDGRVLVTDFGLARAASHEPPSQPGGTAVVAAREPAPSASLSTVTQDDQRVGTPAYMAPEQHAGQAVDARADQFSFCVAMWRSLYGSPPFAGATPAELAVATTSGTTRAPPPTTVNRVPPAVRVALERGLNARPADRFPSMRALLAALAPRPATGRRWLVAGPVIVAAAGALAVWRTQGKAAAPADVCAAQVDRAAEIWNPTVAANLRAVFAKSGAGYAEQTFPEVARQLDARVGEWEAMRRDSCEATRVRGEQSDAMMDVRAACLDHRLADLRSFVDALATADEPVVRDASRAAAILGDVTACGDVATLSRRAPLPPEPSRREAIAAVERALSAARAKSEAGRYREVAALADGLIASARATSYPPVVADALAIVARAESLLDHTERAETLLDEAALAAEAGGDDVLRFDCELALAKVVGYNDERDADGLRHVERATAVLARLGPDLRRSARLLSIRATIDWYHGRYAEAKQRAEEAVGILTRVDPQGADLSSTLHLMAIAEDELGQDTEAVATEDRAIAIGEKAYGPGHPSLANMWNTRGGALRRIERYDEARVSLKKGLDIVEQVYGHDHQLVASALLNLATVDLDEKKFEDAIGPLRGAVEVYVKVLGADHGRVGLARERLGSALSKAGHYPEAEVELRHAIELHGARIGKDSPQVASSWKALGEHYLRAGKPAPARDAYREAVRAFHASQGEKTPLAVRSLMGLGDAELALGHRPAAIAAYEQSVASLAPDTPGLRAEVEGKLAAARGK